MHPCPCELTQQWQGIQTTHHHICNQKKGWGEFKKLFPNLVKAREQEWKAWAFYHSLYKKNNEILATKNFTKLSSSNNLRLC